MAADPEIPFREFVDCRDTRGNAIRVGVGATVGGRVVLLVPDGGVPILNTKQAAELILKLRRVVQDASQRDG
jgi:hypothetical protein